MYLLPRGEQRALVGVTLLLMLSLLVRIAVQIFPGRDPAGVEEFTREARAVMAALARADSLERVSRESLGLTRRSTYREEASASAAGIQIENPEPLNINRADSADLLPLPGIGPVFAGRIIKYRNLLGGYVSVDQLAEVYGMPGETIDLLRKHVFIDSLAIRRIRLDSASFRELLRHPYLEYEDVKALVEYRDFKGEISSREELSDQLVLSESVLNRLAPYLDFQK
jgi:DNA uptake protein ComE-like DNA-binding protein